MEPRSRSVGVWDLWDLLQQVTELWRPGPSSLFLNGVFWVGEHPYEHQDPRCSTGTLHCSQAIVFLSASCSACIHFILKALRARPRRHSGCPSSVNSSVEETAPLCGVAPSPQRDVWRPQAEGRNCSQKWLRIDVQSAIALRL